MSSSEKAGLLCGAILQGILLGLGLFLAIVELASTEWGAKIFRYQGF